MDPLDDPLELLAWTLHADAVEGIAPLAKRLDLNAARISKLSPLAYAASIPCSPECLEALIDAGALVDEPSNDEQTPLHRAAMKSSDAKALLLIRRGASVHARDRYRRTPLHQAAMHGGSQTARALLEHGADLEAKDVEGMTPAMLAANLGNLGQLIFLTDRGARLDQLSVDGESACALAKANGKADCADFIAVHQERLALTQEARPTQAERSARPGL